MIRSLSIEYFKPALLDDSLQVSVKVKELGRSRLTLCQEVLRGQTLLAGAVVNAVCVGVDTLKPVSVPVPLRHKLGKIL
jgi:acyl-CoA thioester hydrolase